MAFIALGAGCFIAALGSLWVGLTGATMDVGSSWSDAGPQRALRWAASFAAVGITSLAAMTWAVYWGRRDRPPADSGQPAPVAAR